MTISTSDAIKAKLLTIAPHATAVLISATLHDIRQSCYWSADISIIRLATIYNGAAGLVSQEQTELLLNALEDIDLLTGAQEERLLADAIAHDDNPGASTISLPERDMDGSYFSLEPSQEEQEAALAWNVYLDSLPEQERLAAMCGELEDCQKANTVAPLARASEHAQPVDEELEQSAVQIALAVLQLTDPELKQSIAQVVKVIRDELTSMQQAQDDSASDRGQWGRNY